MSCVPTIIALRYSNFRRHALTIWALLWTTCTHYYPMLPVLASVISHLITLTHTHIHTYTHSTSLSTPKQWLMCVRLTTDEFAVACRGNWWEVNRGKVVYMATAAEKVACLCMQYVFSTGSPWGSLHSSWMNEKYTVHICCPKTAYKFTVEE